MLKCTKCGTEQAGATVALCPKCGYIMHPKPKPVRVEKRKEELNGNS
jgi:Zn ribbon nucleic-acid-binding protein